MGVGIVHACFSTYRRIRICGSFVLSIVLDLFLRRFGGNQIQASEDDGSINHALIRDYDAEVSRLDRFGEELEEST